jgi:HSP20 family protein
MAMGIRKFVCRQLGSVMGGMMSMARGMMPGALVGGKGVMGLPAVGRGLHVDVCEGMDDVVIVADLPGVEQENVAVRLISPTELGITGVRCSETTETAGGGQVLHRERTCGRTSRVISLPSDTTAECATASLENGVLRVRLRKAERGERIPIE